MAAPPLCDVPVELDMCRRPSAVAVNYTYPGTIVGSREAGMEECCGLCDELGPETCGGWTFILGTCYFKQAPPLDDAGRHADHVVLDGDYYPHLCAGGGGGAGGSAAESTTMCVMSGWFTQPI